MWINVSTQRFQMTNKTNIFNFCLFSLVDTKQLVKECVGGADLQQRKKEIQVYSDQTSATLKKSVYANYMQFIETAKEISRKYFLSMINSF